MQPYSYLISRTRYFLIPWLIFLLIAGIFLGMYPVKDIHLGINAFNNGFLDFIMPWVTLIADGWTVVVGCLLMFAWNRRAAIFVSLACLFPSAVTWTLKSTIFQGEPRPKWYFTHVEVSELHYVPGVVNWEYDSFPSGHTTVAFAFFFALALCARNTKLALLFFILAISVAYSRVYLSQHFLLDVYFGSIIGTIFTLIVFAEGSRMNWIKLPINRRAEN